ncbi:DUF167 family protein [Oceanisphaera pacifica]|uniref:UPF0235 protein J3U76_00875 n=1 Tax=Oceanisphaera pacifica TaxID=2818389 RepID=A0ABS3NC72_9GAMM|nr:DUF167 family protein [Oceanisphaera pacifica]MBO1518196.1 YggU family protein [Oceanisphaera pacifica]
MSEPIKSAVRLVQDTLYLSLYVQTKTSRDRIVTMVGDELKVAITAPPVDGKANAHLLKWLAKQCKVAPSQVQLLSGHNSRHKRVVIHSPQNIPATLSEYLPKST